MRTNEIELAVLVEQGFATRRELTPYIKYERNEGRNNEFGLLMITIFDSEGNKWGYSEEDGIFCLENN